MRRSIRLAIVACAAFATLAVAAPAMAAYTPRLTATAFNNTPGRPTTILLGHVQEDTDDPTLKDTIYAPLGYGVALTQAPNTKIGIVTAILILRQGGNAQVTVAGDVVADTPSTWATQAAQCTGTATHEAVWRLDITVAGTPLKVPLFVDHATGADAAFASAKIQLCLQGPIGTPAGAQLLLALFSVDGVFTNPSTTTDRIWRATFLPYMPGTTNPNPALLVEGQALVPGRVALSLTIKRLKKGVILITGQLLIDGRPFAGATVDIYQVGKSRAIASVRTNRSGRFTVRRRIKKKTRYRAEVIHVDDLPGGCPATPLPGIPQGCKTATISFATTTGNVLARPRR